MSSCRLKGVWNAHCTMSRTSFPHVLQVCAARQRAGQGVLQPVLAGSSEWWCWAATASPLRTTCRSRRNSAEPGGTFVAVVPQH